MLGRQKLTCFFKRAQPQGICHCLKTKIGEQWLIATTIARPRYSPKNGGNRENVEQLGKAMGKGATTGAIMDMKIIKHGVGSVIHMKCNVEGEKRKRSILHKLGMDVHDVMKSSPP